MDNWEKIEEKEREIEKMGEELKKEIALLVEKIEVTEKDEELKVEKKYSIPIEFKRKNGNWTVKFNDKTYETDWETIDINFGFTDRKFFTRHENLVGFLKEMGVEKPIEEIKDVRFLEEL